MKKSMDATIASIKKHFPLYLNREGLTFPLKSLVIGPAAGKEALSFRFESADPEEGPGHVTVEVTMQEIMDSSAKEAGSLAAARAVAFIRQAYGTESRGPR